MLNAKCRMIVSASRKYLFDLIHRKLAIGGHDATIYFIDGFVKDEVLQKLIQQFQGMKEKDMPDNPHKMLDQFIPYFEVDLIQGEKTILKQNENFKKDIGTIKENQNFWY